MKSDDVPDLNYEAWREKMRLNPYLPQSAAHVQVNRSERFYILLFLWFSVCRVQVMNWIDLNIVISQSDAPVHAHNPKDKSKNKVNYLSWDYIPRPRFYQELDLA